MQLLAIVLPTSGFEEQKPLMGTLLDDTKMDTATLIKLCQDGDKEAIGLLYKSYSKQMIRVVCHYVADWQAAQDILHDGFLIIFSRVKQLRDPAKLEYWMAAIMKNLSLQYLKEQDLTLLLTADYDIPDVPEFEETITMEELEAMIKRLPSGYQKVFRLAVLEHKTHKEIGKLLGISEGTSGSQLYHARVLIRKMIIEHKIEMGFVLAALIFLLWRFEGKNPDHSELPIEAEGGSQTEQILADGTSETDTPEEVAPRVMSSYKNKGAHLIDEPLTAKNANAEASSTDTLSLESQPTNYVTQNSDDTLTQSSEATDSLTIGSAPLANLLAEGQDIAPNVTSAGKRSGFGVSINGTISSAHANNDSYYAPTLSGWGYTQSTVSREYTHEIPITIGLSVSKSLSRDLSVESGLQYSLLQTQIEEEEYKCENIKAHYIGLPLKLRMHLSHERYFSLYGSTGVMVELPIAGSVVTSQYASDHETKSSFTPPVQWSVTLGIGIDYSLSSRISLYAETSLNYFFKAHTPYPTIRQDRPLEFNLPVGIRYKW